MWNEIAQWIRAVAATFVTAATVAVAVVYSSGWALAVGAVMVIGMFVAAQVIENKLGEPRACP